MTTLRVSPLLHLALLVDAVATCATGVGMLLFQTELAAILQLPAWLLGTAGGLMLGYALVVAWMSRRESLPRWAVWAVIIGNAVWAIECIVLAVGGLLTPSTLGVAFLLSQAVSVVVFAEMQYFGMRRSTPATSVEPSDVLACD